LVTNNINTTSPVKNVEYIGGNEKVEWEQTNIGLKIIIKGNVSGKSAYAFKITFK